MAHQGEVPGKEGCQLEAQLLQILGFRLPRGPWKFVGNGAALVWDGTPRSPTLCLWPVSMILFPATSRTAASGEKQPPWESHL